jgi:MFS family permease
MWRMTDYTLMTIIAFILFMSRGITGPVNSLYVASLGASYVAIGLLGTITSLTMITFSYVWGRASDHVGQRKVFLVLGLAALAVSDGLIAMAPSYVYLFPLRILGAMAQAAYATSSLALMGDLLERGGEERGQSTRGRRMGTFRGLSSLGFGLMAFLSGSIADWLSLRVPFGLAAFFLLVAFVLSLRVNEPSSGLTSELTMDTGLAFLRALLRSAWLGLRSAVVWLLDVVRRPAKKKHRVGLDVVPVPQAENVERLPLAPLLLSAFLWSLVTGAVYAVWANYMVSELGYSQAAMSRLWALASTTEFPLMILAGWLSDRIGRLPMLSLGFLAWTLVFVGYVLVPGMPWIVFVQLTRGFAYSAFTATAMTYATEVRARAQRGRVSGMYSSAGGIGSILGSSMGGVLTQLTDFRTMIATNAALIFGGAVYLAAVAVRRRGVKPLLWRRREN